MDQQGAYIAVPSLADAQIYRFIAATVLLGYHTQTGGIIPTAFIAFAVITHIGSDYGCC